MQYVSSVKPPSTGESSKPSPAPSNESKGMQSYDYGSSIKPPSEIGVSSRGTLTALSNDIKGIQGYVNVLISGTSSAQRVSPLGNKYFMDTGSQCKDLAGVSQARYAFVNNIPDGNIPIISSAMGSNMKQFRGLVPGILEDLGQINPSSIFSAFNDDSPCQKITMSTRDTANKTGTESRYVTQSDIKNYSACWFPNQINPVSKAKCEGMQSIQPSQLPNDPLLQTYFLGLGAFGAFFLYKIMHSN